MNDLVEFLLARIAEDKRSVNERTRWLAPPGHGLLEHFGDFGDDERWMIEIPAERLLAECEAKRRIIELHDHPDGSCWEMHRGVYGPGWPEGSYAVEGQPWAHPSLEPPEIHPGPCETLQLLALPYANHPDYAKEWRP